MQPRFLLERRRVLGVEPGTAVRVSPGSWKMISDPQNLVIFNQTRKKSTRFLISQEGRHNNMDRQHPVASIDRSVTRSNSRATMEEVDRRCQRQGEVDRRTYSDDLIACTLELHAIAADRNVDYYSNICVHNNFGTHPHRLIFIDQ
jgi:hypothetical protein